MAITMKELEAKLTNVNANSDGFTARCPAHDDIKNSLSVSQAPDGKIQMKCFAGCGIKNICRAIQIQVSDLYPQNKNSSNNIEISYDYTDEEGKLLFQVCRLDPKGFRQRRPDGDGGWLWNLDGVKQVPFNLPGIVNRSFDRNQ